MVPHACCDHTTVARDARHLGQSAYRIVHEVDDELRQGRVELVVSEGQLFRGCDAYVNTGMALACGRDELLRRIDRRDGRRFETSNEFRRQRPRTAADVEHPLAGRDLGKVRKRRRKPNGIPAHEAVVSVGIAGKAHAINSKAAASVGNRARRTPSAMREQLKQQECVHQTLAVDPSSTEY